MIRKLNNQSLKVVTLTETLPQREDMAWLPDGKIIMSDGKKIFFNQPGKDRIWTEIQIPDGSDVLKDVTRLAVSADGKKLAVVVGE